MEFIKSILNTSPAAWFAGGTLLGVAGLMGSRENTRPALMTAAWGGVMLLYYAAGTVSAIHAHKKKKAAK